MTSTENNNELSVHEIQTCCDIAGIMYTYSGEDTGNTIHAVRLDKDNIRGWGVSVCKETAWNRAWDNYVDQLGETR